MGWSNGLVKGDLIAPKHKTRFSNDGIDIVVPPGEGLMILGFLIVRSRVAVEVLAAGNPVKFSMSVDSFENNFDLANTMKQSNL